MQIISPSLFSDKDYYTKDQRKIDFKFFSIEPKIDPNDLITSLKTWEVIEACVEGQTAGYLILGYIGSHLQQQYLPTVLDWIIHTYGNKEIKTLWCSEKEEHCYDFFNQIMLQHASPFEETEKYTNLTEILPALANHPLNKKYHNFLDYWIDKPNEELVCIYSPEDKRQKNFDEFPFYNTARETTPNFRGQGIAQYLYEVGGLWMQSKNMFIHSSHTKTDDGKKLWNIMEQLPQFRILIDSHQDSLLKSHHNSEKNRKKLSII